MGERGDGVLLARDGAGAGASTRSVERTYRSGSVHGQAGDMASGVVVVVGTRPTRASVPSCGGACRS